MSKQTLKKHIASFHEVTSGKSSIAQCAICDKKCHSQLKLKAHIDQSHKKVRFGRLCIFIGILMCKTEIVV